MCTVFVLERASTQLLILKIFSGAPAPAPAPPQKALCTQKLSWPHYIPKRCTSTRRDPSGGHLPAPGGRQRKLLACALRVCRPRLRHSAASTISRGSPSSNDRLPAPRFRHSRGPAQRPLQSTAVVPLEVDTSSTMGLQSKSGACCTSLRTLFCFTSAPHHGSQKAAHADPDRR